MKLFVGRNDVFPKSWNVLKRKSENASFQTPIRSKMSVCQLVEKFSFQIHSLIREHFSLLPFNKQSEIEIKKLYRSFTNLHFYLKKKTTFGNITVLSAVEYLEKNSNIKTLLRWVSEAVTADVFKSAESENWCLIISSNCQPSTKEE